jgi:hypothetical protein
MNGSMITGSTGLLVIRETEFHLLQLPEFLETKRKEGDVQSQKFELGDGLNLVYGLWGLPKNHLGYVVTNNFGMLPTQNLFFCRIFIHF